MKITTKIDYAAAKKKMTTEPKGSGDYKRVTVGGRSVECLVLADRAYMMDLGPGIEVDGVIRHSVEHYCVEIDNTGSQPAEATQGRLSI